MDRGRSARCSGYLVGLPAPSPSPGEWICFLVEPLDGGGRANAERNQSIVRKEEMTAR